jgi:O-antigen/teichoic acid export membrane protein
MLRIIRKYQEYYSNKRIRQVFILSAVNILGIPLTILTSIILTRYLEPSAFGDYKFIQNLFYLVVSLITFGFFQAGNRALVLTKNWEKAREIYGAELVICGFLFILMSLILIFYAFFDNNIQAKGLKSLLILITPLSWSFLLGNYFEVLFQADNKIGLLAKSRLYPQITFFTLILVIYLGYPDYAGSKLKIIVLSYLISQILVFIYIIYKVKPSFHKLKSSLKEIYQYLKSYGFNVYLGSVFAVGFSQLTSVIISYFGVDNSGVGYYSLAITISLPLSFIPNVIATTHYKEFSTMTRIPRKLFMITIFLSFSALVMMWLLVGPFIRAFYGTGYYPVIYLTFIVSIGVIFYGLADFINRFLGSHGHGKALRNSAFIVGISLMVFNFTLVPLFGETGAAYTKAISGIIYIICMIWFYWRTVLKLEKDKVS